MNYGKAIRVIRAIRGISQQELAKRMGVRPSYVSMLERGERNNPSLPRLADAFDVPPTVVALLGADKKDLKHITEDEAQMLGSLLLRVLAESP